MTPKEDDFAAEGAGAEAGEELQEFFKRNREREKKGGSVWHGFVFLLCSSEQRNATGCQSRRISFHF